MPYVRVFSSVSPRLKKIESTDFVLWKQENTFEIIGQKSQLTNIAGYNGWELATFRGVGAGVGGILNVQLFIFS